MLVLTIFQAAAEAPPAEAHPAEAAPAEATPAEAAPAGKYKYLQSSLQ